MVLIVRWSRISGFEVAWSISNSSNSWMAKNGLIPYLNALGFYVREGWT